MAYDDLRQFIRRLDEGGELVRVTASVNRDLEITEITDRVSKGPAEENKALLFENVEGSDMPVLRTKSQAGRGGRYAAAGGDGRGH